MKREIEKKLEIWKNSEYRKPLIIRGARQVGKTYTIKKFGENHFENFVNFDFERDKSLHKIFEGDIDPGKIILYMEAHAGKRIKTGDSLLFFDEIQCCPNAILSLRYFYELMPKLHIIAAGSLLEFTMGEFSFPVGRVEFEWMRPMSFYEFLEASGNQVLLGEIPDFSDIKPVHEFIHEKIIEQLKLYFLVGGMPEAVKRFLKTKSMVEVAKVHKTLADSYIQSLSKYNKRADIESLENVLLQIPKNVGNQIKYRNLDPERRIEKTKTSLQILERALLIHSIKSTSASGIPLGAGSSTKVFKYLFLDIGFMQHLCGIDANIVLNINDVMNIWRGALAEQFVGQQLLADGSGSENSKLFYWSRAKKNSSAEVDYLIVRSGKIYPVEVKSGPAGRLRSIQLFLKEHKNCQKGIVLSSKVYKEECINNLIFMPLYSKI